MSRPTKYNQEKSRHLVNLLKNGETIKNACKQCEISEDSFARWRKLFPDFAEEVGKARNIASKSEKLIKTVHEALKDQHAELLDKYMGLPVYYELSDDIPPNEPFYYPPENAVQFFDMRRIRYSCPTDLWARKHSACLYGDEWTEEP